jgi:hypothetical protein
MTLFISSHHNKYRAMKEAVQRLAAEATEQAKLEEAGKCPECNAPPRENRLPTESYWSCGAYLRPFRDGSIFVPTLECKQAAAQWKARQIQTLCGQLLKFVRMAYNRGPREFAKELCLAPGRYALMEQGAAFTLPELRVVVAHLNYLREAQIDWRERIGARLVKAEDDVERLLRAVGALPAKYESAGAGEAPQLLDELVAKLRELDRGLPQPATVGGEISGRFKARVWFSGRTDEFDPEVYVRKVWDEELTPVKRLESGGRDVADWARESLYSLVDDEQWRRYCQVPDEGNWEAVVAGEISGRLSRGPEGDDWSEDVDVVLLAKQALPDDWEFEPERERSLGDE